MWPKAQLVPAVIAVIAEEDIVAWLRRVDAVAGAARDAASAPFGRRWRKRRIVRRV